jgi:FlaA1/EpsC-like NDP-sugar epimerase
MDRPISRETLGGIHADPPSHDGRVARRRRSLANRFARVRPPTGRDFFLLDILSVALAVVLTFDLRYEGFDGLQRAISFGPIVALPIVIRPIVQFRLGLYQRVWQYASIGDLMQILLSIAIGSGLAIVGAYGVLGLTGVASLSGFPVSFWILEAILSLAFIAGTRLSLRALNELRMRQRRDRHDVKAVETLLFGAGEAGAAVARSAIRERRAGVRAVGFLDDDRTRTGQRVAGLPVLGTLDDLDNAIVRTGARQLLITMPNAGGDAIRRVTRAALAAGLQVRTVPPLHELLDGTLDAYRVRRLQVEDLLRRPLVTDRLPMVEPMITGKTVMITGGGGSIGGELARQVWSLGPSHLVLVDRAESALYAIQRELLGGHHETGRDSRLSVHLANVASRAVVERLIRQVEPDIIFHAAAYKHVPLMETHPSDAVQVNIGGTLAVLEAAEASGVERFVLVSTDKAVEPSSVMGATKRVAEWLVGDVAERSGRAYVSVRFGNVLGSNGSVVPIFQNQLERGEPLTITHPDMTRYFMTIPEAAWLILDAAALGRPGQTFVLDMGEPISIIDLAKDLARLAGRDPESVPIEITGLRPGEKLTEALFYDTEQVQKTASPKVMLISAGAPPPGIRDTVRGLLMLASGEHDDVVRRELFALVNGEPASERASDEAEPEVVGIPIVTEELEDAREAVSQNGNGHNGNGAKHLDRDRSRV